MSSSFSAGLKGLVSAVSIAALPVTAIAQEVAWAYVSPIGEGSSWQPAQGFQHTPLGDPVTVERVGAGQNRFRVRFPGLQTSNSVVHVTAVDGNHTAVVNSWTSVAGEVQAVVETFDATGAPAVDGRFSIMFRHGGDNEQRHAHLWANDGSAASYTPSTFFSWNGNRPDPTITRSGTGSYVVVLPELAAAGDELGHVQVSPYSSAGTPLRAKVRSWGLDGTDVRVEVRCFDVAGNPTDGRFTLSYNETAAPIAGVDGSGAHVWANDDEAASYTPDSRYTDSNGTFGPLDSESIRRIGIGEYRVHLPNLVPAESSTVQVTGYGADSDYATIRNWVGDGCGGTFINIETFDATGNPSDARFTVLYLTNRPIVMPEVAWAYVDPAGQGASFTPLASYQHNSSGAAITVTRDPVQQNRFLVLVPSLENDGAVQVSAHGGNHTAVVNGWSNVGDDVRIAVELFDASGGPADNARFLVHYRRGGNNRSREAYLYANQPSAASYTPSPFYSWNANRPDPTITRIGVGDYRVTLPGLAARGTEFGNVQVSPYGPELRRVSVARWLSTGDDLRVSVRTTDAGGDPADARFVLSFNEIAAPISIHEGSGAHVWANEPGQPSYSPAPGYTDSNGTVGPADSETIERIAIGRYRVLLPNVVASSSATVQVSPYGSGAAYASVGFFNEVGLASGTQVFVETFDASGAPIDARFLLNYLTNRPATGERPASNSSYGSSCHGLALEAVSRPILCLDWDLHLSGVPAGSLAGFLLMDVFTQDVSLAPFGASGCSLLNGAVFTIGLALPLPDSTYSVPIPAAPDLLGLDLHAQAAVLNPGVNALGVATSNGVTGVLGDR